MLQVGDSAPVRATIGIAFDNEDFAKSISRILSASGQYQLHVFRKADVARGIWPLRQCGIVVTNPDAYRNWRRAGLSVVQSPPIILLVMTRRDLSTHRRMIADAHAFVIVEETLRRLQSAVPLSCYGLSIMPRTDNTRLISGHFEQMKHLSPQQTLILRELGHGLGNDAIARRLDLSLSMTKAQVKRIVEQLGLRNRTDAALFGASLLTADSSQHTSFG